MWYINSNCEGSEDRPIKNNGTEESVMCDVRKKPLKRKDEMRSEKGNHYNKRNG